MTNLSICPRARHLTSFAPGAPTYYGWPSETTHFTAEQLISLHLSIFFWGMLKCVAKPKYPAGMAYWHLALPFRNMLATSQHSKLIITHCVCVPACLLVWVIEYLRATNWHQCMVWVMHPSHLLPPPPEMAQEAWPEHLAWITASLQRLTEEEEEGNRWEGNTLGFSLVRHRVLTLVQSV